ncbi:hypothetical protein EJ03DRAFT_351106 [Teratosphaeria nubilosa]|uniref:Uncharacterized protein n=1 Tax=Teratosphaeria nubilosa TaxID=161662 RepID=A0A6G1LAI7_9PEZI|nr:hypothetical protein EJ03DRAFT_351106 [Teratosphaeria nubilosa]
MHLVTRTLAERSSSSTESASSSTCSAGDNSAICQKPTSGSSTGNLAIALGAAIPITCALVICFFLHRRFVKRQRIEDAHDPHRSLDFGVDLAPSQPGKRDGNGAKGVPEMTITDLGSASGSRRTRGLSMDIGGNPYLLPAGLQSSHESIHSMSRSMIDEHDPYRPITMLRTSSESNRPKPFLDNASVYSQSTMHSLNEKGSLIRNAQRMSRTDPMARADSMSPHDSKSSEDLLGRQMRSSNRSMPPSRKQSMSSESPLPDIHEKSEAMSIPPRKQSMPSSAQSPPPPVPPKEQVEQMPPPCTASAAPLPPRKSSVSAVKAGHESIGAQSVSSDYGDAPAPPVIPMIHAPDEHDDNSYDIDPSVIRTGRFSIDGTNLFDQFPAEPQPQRLSMMGLRPLPTDLPEDNPEIRANRIRSFYKEYFDDSRPHPAHGHYEEDYDAGYMGGGAIFDPASGTFIMPGGPRPFAQPVGRRAMTPPPRGAPRGSGGPIPPHARHYSTMSAGRPRGRAPSLPKRKLPPPEPLQGLPTPSKLKHFDSVISGVIDFAPPTSFRAMQNGSHPDSPLGVTRPFSPHVKAYSPLASSFDNLSAIPSPHLLRKSGTFTSLDFAPPGRIRDPDGGSSDAGSIRSARSGISAMQMDAVRAGAYRVSRIPKEMVTTRDDLANQLRPKMSLVSDA